MISEFDERLTVPVFGFASLSDYYSACRNDDKLHAVSRPLLCISAEDDPFVPLDCELGYVVCLDIQYICIGQTLRPFYSSLGDATTLKQAPFCSF